MPSPDQSLEQFLAELEAEYAKLADRISFIRERLGLDPLPDAEAPTNSVTPRFGGTFRGDEFFGMSVPDAIKSYLGMVKKPQSPKEIETALLAGGLITTSKSFYANVFTALKRLRASKEVMNVPGGWGLADWYKGRTMTTEQGAAARKKKSAKRGRKKPKRSTGAKPPSSGSKAKTGWHEYLAGRLKEGKTMQEAGAEWKAMRGGEPLPPEG